MSETKYLLIIGLLVMIADQIRMPFYMYGTMIALALLEYLFPKLS